ncbi:MAG: hypothetical protein IKI55_02870 [Bacilli bacterium]|nr:hypothetical protein [Bacilli bacterium]
MSKTKKKTSKGLLGFYIASAVLTALHLIFFFIFGFLTEGVGDPEVNGIGSVFSYHFQGVGKLFGFAYGEDLGSFALSVLLYAFIICFVIFLVAAAIVATKKNRRIMWWAVAIVGVDLIGYAVFASGTAKYFQILNSEGVFAGQTGLVFVTYALIILGIVHFVCSMVSYFWSIVEAYKNPGLVDEEEEKRAKQGEYSAIETNSYGEKTHRNAPQATKTAKRAYIIQNFYECRHKGCKKKKA